MKHKIIIPLDSDILKDPASLLNHVIPKVKDVEYIHREFKFDKALLRGGNLIIRFYQTGSIGSSVAIYPK